MDFQIKKSDIAINAADARPSRFTGGGDERIDVAIKSLDLSKRKVVLSIKLLEELDRAEALEKFGTTDSTGKSLPFSNLADDLLKKKIKRNKELIWLSLNPNYLNNFPKIGPTFFKKI